MTLTGMKLRYRYESGLDVSARFDAADRMTWRASSGPAAGRSDTESIQVATVGEDIHFVCWVERSGVTVSQVIDLTARRIVSFVTYDTPDGRRSVLDRGSIAIGS